MDSEKMQLRDKMGAYLVDILDRFDETQEHLGELLSIGQPNICRLKKSNFRSFSLERIILLINKCGYDVNISVSPSIKTRGSTMCGINEK